MINSIAWEKTGHLKAAGLRCWPSPDARIDLAQPDFPADARDWVEPCTLTLWVRDEVEAVNCVPTTPGRHLSRTAVPTMLTLLTFAYATSVLDSVEINRACRCDPAFRFLCDGSPPFPDEIIKFRRQHHLELQSLLARVFAKLIAGGAGAAVSTPFPFLWQEARDRLDVARQLDGND